MFNRSFIALWLAFFSATLGLGMVGPILPLYAQQLGARGVALGFAFTGFAVVQVLLTPFSGRLSDRGGRKRLILLGLLVYASVALGYHSVHAVTPLILLRMLSGVGTSLVFPLTVAYAGELAPVGREGAFMGVFSVADVFGFGLGPLAGGALRALFGFSAVFLAMATLILVAALGVWLFVPSRPRRSGPAMARPPASLRRLSTDPLLQAVFLTKLVWSIAEGASYSFLAILIAGRMNSSALLVGVALSTRDLVTGGCVPLMGRLADRSDRMLLAPIGLALLALLELLLPFLPNYATLIIVLAAAGVSTSLFTAAASALQVQAGRELGMGAVMGAMETAVGAGLLIGSVAGGLATGVAGIAGPFLIAGCCGLAASAVFPLLGRRLRVQSISEGAS